LHLPDRIGNHIRALKNYGVWIGRRVIYLPKLLRPEAASLLGLLWGVWQKRERIPPHPQPGLTSFNVDRGAPDAFLAACGFRVVAGRAIRFDMLERLEDELEKGAASGQTADALLPRLVSLLGCGNDQLRVILDRLGWRVVEVSDAGAGVRTVWRRSAHRRSRRNREGRPEPKPARPTTASLAELAARFSRK
jgi:ATP-dependent RNA helicase SUPV3L1/SUV3